MITFCLHRPQRIYYNARVEALLPFPRGVTNYPTINLSSAFRCGTKSRNRLSINIMTSLQ